MSTQWTVLVVDDEPNFSRVLEAKLSRSGYAVLTASDATTALGMVRDNPIQLVLLDLHLPDADGISVLPHIRLLTGGTPVVLMTAYEQEGLKDRGLLAGAADVLYKPFDLDQLVAMTSRVIGAHARLEPMRLGQVIEVWPAGIPERRTAARVMRKAPDTILIVTEDGTAIGPGPVVVEIPGDDGVYTFETSVEQADEEGRSVVRRPSVIYRKQRRMHARAPFSETVALLGPGGEHVADGAGFDLCEGGLALVANHVLPLGDVTEAVFDLPDAMVPTHTSVRVNGRVVRTSEVDGERAAICHMAIAFVNLPEPAHTGIREYVRRATSI